MQIPLSEIEFKKKAHAEIRKLETDRFDEGLRIKKDPRIDKNYDLERALGENPKIFHENWLKSLCKTCENWRDCGFKCASDCNFHKPS